MEDIGLQTGWGWHVYGWLFAFGLTMVLTYIANKDRIFAEWLWPKVSFDVDKGLADKKRELFQHHVEGHVLEIGAGVGANCRYFDPAKIRKLYLNEPSRAMHLRLMRTAFDAGFGYAAGYSIENRQTPVELVQGTAEKITMPPESLDVVVCTLVLCSVAHPELVLGQMHRVLKPGGKLLFLEHIAAPRDTELRRRQERWNWLWRCLPLDGCCVNRPTDEILLAEPGFEPVGQGSNHSWISYFDDLSGPALASPTCMGGLVKKPAPVPVD